MTVTLHVVIPFAFLCVVSLVLLTNTLPTTVGTYMRALYSITTAAAQEERRSTRVYQRRAANPTPGSAVDSRRAGAAEACALHADACPVDLFSLHRDLNFGIRIG